ncbi:c-type cytochrome [Pseudoduganella umbonata]|uniref:C-type cytochrome n=1 Tax=Pseudoduganella umbonata TaxID=864828 RepID=A0A4P8HU34_9BURK|nr:c-type cytochrome [Pseudoduganella umbonata]MBB3225257.1 cytochrome c553 [Pseudoduganella umbonata]QCP12272.1 c-type cytochrome [Pseudoduganella umbonata]
MKMMTLLMPVLLSAPALAAEPVSAGERLAATCTACHGTRSNIAGSALPPLAGQPKETLLGSLKAFKDGSRPATIMTQLAKGYTDEQLAQIADWFAAQKGDRP